MSIAGIGVNLYAELEVLMSYTIVATPVLNFYYVDIIVPVTNPRLDGAMPWPGGMLMTGMEVWLTQVDVVVQRLNQIPPHPPTQGFLERCTNGTASDCACLACSSSQGPTSETFLVLILHINEAYRSSFCTTSTAVSTALYLNTSNHCLGSLRCPSLTPLIV
jgi:hypothetical protein